MKYLALDFGGSALKYGLVDDRKLIVETGKRAAPLESVEAFVETVVSLYEKYADQIEGIAISLPGYIDPESGYLFGSGAYQKLYGRSIPELLHTHCPVNIAVENDGKCGALSEAWKGALRDCRDGAVIIIGSGIGGGLIKNGKIHSGKGFAAGELSYLLTRPGEYDFSSMAMMDGCLAGMAFKLCKLKNLDMHIQDMSELLLLFDQFFSDRYPQFDEPPQKIKADGKQMWKWLREGDQIMQEVYRQFIEAVGAMIFNIQIIYAPETIVIGGGISREDNVMEDIQGELERYYTSMQLLPQLRTRLVRSEYLDECNLLGAVYNYICKFGK